MDKVRNLLNKYYKGETSLEEEALLKQILPQGAEMDIENKLFSYFLKEGESPVDLEDGILKAIRQKENKAIKIRKNIFRYTSLAAAFTAIISIGLIARNKQQQKMEEQFQLIEQAMYKISNTIVPEEHEDMLVLWIDNNVEIIIN